MLISKTTQLLFQTLLTGCLNRLNQQKPKFLAATINPLVDLRLDGKGHGARET